MKNPIFSTLETSQVTENSASLKGVILKTTLLLLIAFVSAMVVITMFMDSSVIYVLLPISSVIGVIAVMFGRFNPNASAIAGVIYAACEGVFLGALSGTVASVPGYEGAVAIAVVATFSIFMVMLILYSTKIVQATPTLFKVLGAAALGIVVFSLITFISSIFTTTLVDMFYGNSLISAIIAALFIAYGSFMLVLNFNEAESYIKSGLDKKYEWVAALGLIVTIVYIYVQVLRFVMIFLDRSDN